MCLVTTHRKPVCEVFPRQDGALGNHGHTVIVTVVPIVQSVHVNSQTLVAELVVHVQSYALTREHR